MWLFGKPPKRLKNTQPSLGPSPGQRQQNYPSDDELEEDGFLLVGETAAERSTVMPGQHNSDQSGLPTYSSQVDSQEMDTSLPSYTRAVQNFTQKCNTQSVISNNIPGSTSHTLGGPGSTLGGHILPPGGASVSQAVLPLSQVPFHLSPVLELDSKIKTLKQTQVNLVRPDLNGYYYDFSFERSVVRESSVDLRTMSHGIDFLRDGTLELM